MRPDKIVIRGAREHNLKNVTVEIPRDQLVVLTGVSGRVSRHLPLTRYMRRGNGATSSRSRPTRVSSSAPGAEAAGGLHRRTFAGHLYRAEDREQEPALDGRNRH